MKLRITQKGLDLLYSCSKPIVEAREDYRCKNKGCDPGRGMYCGKCLEDKLNSI